MLKKFDLQACECGTGFEGLFLAWSRKHGWVFADRVR